MDGINLDELNGIGLEPIPTQKIPTKLEEVKMENKTVESCVKVLKFVGKIGVAIKESLADDGKITITDAGNFLGVITATPGVIAAIPDVPAELADTISDEEKQLIVDAVKETGLIPENVEEAVTEGIKLAADIKNYVFKYIIK